MENYQIIHPRFESKLERELLGTEVLARKVRGEWLRAGLEGGLFGVFGLLWLFTVFFWCWWSAARRYRNAVRFPADGPPGGTNDGELPEPGERSDASEGETGKGFEPSPTALRETVPGPADAPSRSATALLTGVFAALAGGFVLSTIGITFYLLEAATVYFFAGAVACALVPALFGDSHRPGVDGRSSETPG